VIFSTQVTSRPEEQIVQRLSEYNPLEIKCDDAASRADVIEFVTAVLAAEPARLQGDLLITAVRIVEEKCKVICDDIVFIHINRF
jgi:hypothetical protein